MTSLYLDYNATTPVEQKVIAAMLEVWRYPYNPSSIHKFGQKAKLMLENARKQVADAINVDSDYNVVFTSSGTESNNLALRGFPRIKIITSVIEHPSVLRVAGEGLIPVLRNGAINLEALEVVLKSCDERVMVSIMHANNETGVIQPLAEAIQLAKKYGALIHTDATQTLGKIDCEWGGDAPDLITISAHKFGGPQGVAALAYHKNLDLQPLMCGGGQEFRIRPGTHNLAAIVGMGEACSLIPERLNHHKNIVKLRDHAEAEIKATCPEAIIFGDKARRLPNTSSISMPGVKAETQVIHFDLEGIALSAGSACSSGRVDIPYVHAAMGYNMEEAGAAIRISLGPATQLKDIECFIAVWQRLYHQTSIKRAS